MLAWTYRWKERASAWCQPTSGTGPCWPRLGAALLTPAPPRFHWPLGLSAARSVAFRAADRSRMAVATTASPNTAPHSLTARLLVISIGLHDPRHAPAGRHGLFPGQPALRPSLPPRPHPSSPLVTARSDLAQLRRAACRRSSISAKRQVGRVLRLVTDDLTASCHRKLYRWATRTGAIPGQNVARSASRRSTGEEAEVQPKLIPGIIDFERFRLIVRQTARCVARSCPKLHYLHSTTTDRYRSHSSPSILCRYNVRPAPRTGC